MHIKSIVDADIKKDSRIFVRTDLDVPLKDGVVLDTFRLDRALPTLKYIIEKQAKPVIAGHLGKPKGQTVPELSTKHLQSYFDENLGINKYELVENLRFDPREEANSAEFAEELIQKYSLDIYVNESFATSHREHASIMQLPKLLPAYAGLNLLTEVEVLQKLLNNPERPFIAIIGGAKVESKSPTIANLLKKADKVLLAGRLGLEWTQEVPENLEIPRDYTDNRDIGSNTLQAYLECLRGAKTIIWAGPIGMWEDPNYIKGTKTIAQQITEMHVYTVVGGGDTIAALNHLELTEGISFISTGGSAMLQFLANETLPGLEIIQTK